MSMQKIVTACFLLPFCLATAQAKEPPPFAPLTSDQIVLVRRAIAAERITIASIRQHAPLVQTYIQKMGTDGDRNATPVSDQYMLQRVDFGSSFRGKPYRPGDEDAGVSKDSAKALHSFAALFGLRFVGSGFLGMMFVDPSGFDEQHYEFAFVRGSFLGSIRTAEFDVRPLPHTGSGRFIGRVWIDDDSGSIVRFNGTYSGGNDDEPDHNYFHLDSWRQNLQTGLWLPVGIYVEEGPSKHDLRKVDFKAQTQVWGYALKRPSRASENELMHIDDVVDQSGAAEDLSPVQAQRAWIERGAQNVVDRLTEAGLIAIPSDFDHVLETVTNNLILGSSLELDAPIRCRVLLTTPLESVAIGNTIVLSRGLIDTLPSESALAAVLAFQLAHILLGHHVDTRYAFDDRLLFADDLVFERIRMQQSAADDAAAATKAVALLDGSIYKDKEGEAGLYFAQLETREKELTALNTPRLGDSLLDASGAPWMKALRAKAPPLAVRDLGQLAALPLGSQLRLNAWDDSVISLHAKPTRLLNVREKMPFEIAPLFVTLGPYTQAAGQSATAVNPSP